MNINVIFDSSVTNAGGPPQAFQNDVNAVVSYLEGQYTDNISFNLHVGYGEVNGTALGANALGESNTFYHSYSYSAITNALKNHSNTTDDATAYATLPNSDPVSGTHTWWVANPQAEALGLLTNTTVDEYVGFADSSHATFDYNRADGITSGQFDFIGTVAHEITEVMGRSLGVEENDINNAPTDYITDLFHYSSPNTRDFSRGGYFSFDNGQTDRGDFNNSDPNGDAGDWAASVVRDSFLDISNPGVYNDISQNDLRLMDVIGYDRRVDDFGDDTNFAGRVAVNGSTTGTLENILDSDWFRVQLNAGVHYTIRVAGADAGAGTVQHPFVAVFDSSSNELAFSQEGATDARLDFTPSSSGFYYVDAASFFGAFTGTYTVSVNVDDFLGDTTTTAQLAMGGQRTGNLEVTGDHDWFAVQLAAGHNYIIDERGSPSGGGTLSDSYVRLHNAGGTEIAHDDDSGVGLDSQLAVHVSNSGTYYVDAGAYADLYTGTYTIGVQDLGTASTRFETPDFSSAQLGNNEGWTSQHQFPRELADINGDGLADIVGFGNDGVYVSLATGDGHFAPLSFALSANFAAQFGWTSDDQFPRALADVNGDGMADIVGFGNNGVYVSLATGGGHFAPSSFELGASFGAQLGWSSQDQFPRELADVNGDGRADIVGFGNDGVYVALATSNGHFAAPTFALNSYGNQLGWTSDNQFPRELADVNGDGKADIVGFGNEGVWVSLATGNGHFAAPTLAISQSFAAGWTSQDQFPRELADVNGDGMADIVGFGTNGIYVALATGNGHFAAPTSDLAAYGTNFGWASQDQFPRELADVTGDHRADIVAFGNDGTYVSASHDFLVV